MLMIITTELVHAALVARPPVLTALASARRMHIPVAQFDDYSGVDVCGSAERLEQRLSALQARLERPKGINAAIVLHPVGGEEYAAAAAAAAPQAAASDEAAAKAAWLAKQEVPSWGPRAAAAASEARHMRS